MTKNFVTGIRQINEKNIYHRVLNVRKIFPVKEASETRCWENILGIIATFLFYSFLLHHCLAANATDSA